MFVENQNAWLRLALTPGLDFELCFRLLKAFGLPEDIFNQRLSNLMSYVPQKLALEIHKEPTEEVSEKIQKIEQLIEKYPSVRLLVPSDKDFPSKFLSIPRPPLITLCSGNLALLNGPTVSFLGSTHPTEEGVQIARSWAKALAKKNSVFVQGDSLGIERETLAAVRQTNPAALIIVARLLLDEENFEAKLQFTAENGLLLCPLDGLDQLWQSRQRLLVAATDHFVVIEASIRSRVLPVVREAADIGRNIMAVPGSIYSPLSKGCHKLIREGAKLVESIDEIEPEIKKSC